MSTLSKGRYKSCAANSQLNFLVESMEFAQPLALYVASCAPNYSSDAQASAP